MCAHEGPVPRAFMLYGLAAGSRSGRVAVYFRRGVW
jgi:hypothetical protein